MRTGFLVIKALIEEEFKGFHRRLGSHTAAYSKCDGFLNKMWTSLRDVMLRVLTWGAELETYHHEDIWVLGDLTIRLRNELQLKNSNV